ncbi:uncharacterized protein ACHE_21461S [Aspergillus chevalieri]|uniref:Uncharacterized protein n=1 Tax=Aspergillus chevalieri TaxID=182096 RepID=A0A7R7VLB9_ASPCH|nr:uncharacterized protein ACHE_21461S [Aspergillus chevalieri]BCR86003.1 hypothetical protein ACHE_21461S [Aspergillus chevalieri]
MFCEKRPTGSSYSWRWHYRLDKFRFNCAAQQSQGPSDIPSRDVHHKASITIYFITHCRARSLNSMDRGVITFDIGLSLRPITTVWIPASFRRIEICRYTPVDIRVAGG